MQRYLLAGLLVAAAAGCGVPAGTVITAHTMIDFGAVKLGESCS